MIKWREYDQRLRLPAFAGAGRPAAGDPLRAEPVRLSASRPRLRRAGRLRVRACRRRPLPSAHRGHRRQPLPAGVRGRHLRGPALARPRLGRPGAAPVGAARRLSPACSSGWTTWACSTPASAPAARSAPRSPMPARRRTGRRAKPFIQESVAAWAMPSAGRRIAAGEPFATRLDVGQVAGADRPAGLARRARGHGAGRAGAAGRRRAGAQGCADQLPPGGDGRRCAARSDPGDPRRGSVPCDPCAPPAAGAARVRHAALLSPQPDRRFRPGCGWPSATGR